MSEDRVRKLTANKRYLFFANLFTELKFTNAVTQLFYVSRGLNVGQIVFLSIIWSVVILLAELPSSILADKIGRKKTIIIGVSFLIMGTIAMFFAHGLFQISLAVIFTALGFAFNSGTDEALLYDTLKELKQESFSTKVSGKYFSSSYLAKIFTPLIGSIIAKDLLPWQFNLLISFDLTGAVFALAVSFKLIEPERFKSFAKEKKEVFKETWHIVSKNIVLLKYSLNKIGIFVATFVYWRVYQLYLEARGIEVFYLGVIYFFFQSILFISLWNTEKIKNKIGLYPMFTIPPLVGILSLLMIILLPVKPILIVGTILLFSVGTIRDSIFLTQIQLRIKSFNRATTTSALSIIKSILDIPILFLVSYLVNQNVTYAFYVSLIIFVLVLVFANIKKEDILETR